MINHNLAINQLEQMRRENMDGDMKSQRVAAINFGIRAIKKYQKSKEEFFRGYITCALTIAFFLIVFKISMRS